MKRTTVSLPEEAIEKASALARRRRQSLGSVVRDALLAYLDRDAGWDPPRSLGAGDSQGAARGRGLGDLPADAYGAGPES